MEGKNRPQIHRIIPTKRYSIQEAKQFFLAKQYTPPAAQHKWNQPIHFNWEAQYKLAKKMTIETKLQAFQFTILHRTVAHRRRLYFKRCVKSPYCMCNTGTHDTIEHRFLECKDVQPIWEYYQKKMFKLTNYRPLININSCLLGIVSKDTNVRNWNWIALQIKYFIHKCRLNDQIPNIVALEAMIKCQLKTLSYLAYKGKEKEDFKKQWAAWLQ